MKCKYSYAWLDSSGFPIPGQVLHFDKPQCDNCSLALLPTTQMSSANHCTHPSGLRFFYTKDKQGRILTITSSLTRPKTNQNCTLEFFKTCS